MTLNGVMTADSRHIYIITVFLLS